MPSPFSGAHLRMASCNPYAPLPAAQVARLAQQILDDGMQYEEATVLLLIEYYGKGEEV